MNFVYTTPWMREQVKTPEAYQEWLATLQNDDRVLLQSFSPPTFSGYPLERWEFELARVSGKRLLVPDSKPLNRSRGTITYWNTDADWGDVFPARIVPCHSQLICAQTREVGGVVYGHYPVYEPDFLGCLRHVYRVNPGGASKRQGYSVLRELFPRNYRLEVANGVEIVHCFSALLVKELPKVDHPLVDYLYSERLEG